METFLSRFVTFLKFKVMYKKPKRKEILYIPTNKLVLFFPTYLSKPEEKEIINIEVEDEGDNQVVTAGYYVTSGGFFKEFNDSAWFKCNKDPYELIIDSLINVNYVEDSESFIFSNIIYKFIGIDRDFVKRKYSCSFNKQNKGKLKPLCREEFLVIAREDYEKFNLSK